MTEPKQWAERRISLEEAPYAHMIVAVPPFSPHPEIEITAYIDEYAAVTVRVKIGAVQMLAFLTRTQARQLGASLVAALEEAEKREGKEVMERAIEAGAAL